MIEVDLIKKHGKKVLGMAEHNHQKQTWRQRLPEILLEIGIIVFAIMLSIQLHAWHEHALDKQAEREFLTGLKTDLQNDLKELGRDSLTYVQMRQGFRYFAHLTPQNANKDTIEYASGVFYTLTQLIPNNSRFEGFKSAGKLTVIEDKELLNNILDLYQEFIPGLLEATQDYSLFIRDQLRPYLDEHLNSTDSNLVTVVAAERMKRYLQQGQSVDHILYRYHATMQQSRRIIKKIDQTLADD